MDVFTVTTRSPAETRAWGARLARACEPGQVIALRGDLGSGKTVFAQGVGAGLGVAEPISSPTFNLAQSYVGRLILWHLDAYRLASPEELEDLSWDDLLAEPGILLVEWAERIAAALPPDRLDVSLFDAGDDARRLEIRARGPRSRAALERLQQEAPRATACH